MDIEKATLKKATVRALPLWADPEAESKYSALQTIRSGHGHTRGSISPPPTAHTTANNAGPNDVIDPSLKAANGTPQQLASSSSSHPFHASPSVASHVSLSNIFHHPRQASTTNGEPSTSKSHSSLTTTAHLQQQPSQHHQELQGRLHTPSTFSLGNNSTVSSSPPDWSVFATMNNVSTLANQVSQKVPLIQQPENDADEGTATSRFSLRRITPKLEEIFKGGGGGKSAAEHQPGCTCNCPGMQGGRSTSTSRRFLTSKRQAQMESLSATRGYPTGQCVSTDPPEDNTWDEKDDMALTRKQSIGTNRTINMDAVRGFVNSPFFSNVLKSLTVMAAVSVFAIALDSVVLLVKTPDQKLRLANDNACMIITVILSVLTIAYSVFNIFLESRRPPEGLDTTRSKPLTVIISEIVASILWSQVLSITIYMYIWTYGCTAAGQEQLKSLWRDEVIPDPHLQERLCRRQGAMVGLEALLVLLLIVNFYTHIDQNFKFIRAVS
ncbi:hypothetical protein DFQ26_005841 [Actinomortierella ambigua]|nr:hypothetical protein DFQ26_005841 [Actinomortierella ambigua]